MKKTTIAAIESLARYAERARCYDLHHPPEHQHEANEPCKAQIENQRQVKIARDYITNMSKTFK